MKKILLLVILLIFSNITFAQVTQYFNPFQWGIKTVQGINVDEGLRRLIREKMAELLNNRYGEGTFEVRGNSIESTDPNINVNDAVRETYGNWSNLIIEAAELILIDPPPSLQQYRGFKVLNVQIENGQLEKLYIAPSEYLRGFPTIRECERGIGQCLLFLFDKGLRILYTLSLALGVLFLMWAGILYITKPSQVSDVHKRVQWGIIGIVVGIVSFTIVIGVERWLTGGLALQPPSELGPITTDTAQPIPDITQPIPDTTQSILPSGTASGTLIIDTNTAKIDENGRFFVFVSSKDTCELTLTFYNKTKGKNLFSKIEPNIFGSQYIEAELGNHIEPGDFVRVAFQSNNCNLNITYLDIQYRPKVEVVVEELPKLTIKGDKLIIYASQYIRVEMPDNLKDALEQLLGITVLQRNIYQPPFSMYIEYEVQPTPKKNGNCTLYGVMRGTSVSSFNFDKTKATSLYLFNRDFQITLSYEKGKSLYRVPKYISPPGNTLGFLYIQFYDYKGQCEVEITNSEFPDKPFSQVFDIETGKIYTPGGSGWNIIKQILGL